MYNNYEAVIGLEVHAELSTRSKIFCACPTTFGAPPNTACCPVCTGFPGTLPVLNRAAVCLGIKAGLATGCEISREVRFHRKHYTYPDLPKAYQITQYDLPLCSGGGLTFTCESGEKTVEITRIHLEEDAGKLIHTKEGYSLVDHNRCGVPLIEIVTEPQIHCAEEAVAFLKALRSCLLYAGVSDCKMQEGSLRCDVNLSVRKKGETALGIRTEMKNLNSFTAVAGAIDAEFARQVKVLENGGEIYRETRRFDEQKNQTLLLRRKESVSDYRFLPEPDLPPFFLESSLIEDIQNTLPELPASRRARYQAVYGATEEESRLLTSSPHLANFFESCASQTTHTKLLINLLLGEILRTLPADPAPSDFIASPAAFAEVSTLWGEGKLNSTAAKRLAILVWQGEQEPVSAMNKLDLAQNSSPEAIDTWIEEVFAANPDMLESYRKGKTNVVKAMTGAVMAASKGKANPVMLKTLLEKRLATL